MIDIKSLEEHYQLLVSMQNNLCSEIIHQIFILNAYHFDKKWRDANYNIFYFLASLDDYHRILVFNWGKTLSN
jgi:hypothetical protein